jgi:accessory gene regulator protein AgrB
LFVCLLCCIALLDDFRSHCLLFCLVFVVACLFARLFVDFLLFARFFSLDFIYTYSLPSQHPRCRLSHEKKKKKKKKKNMVMTIKTKN